MVPIELSIDCRLHPILHPDSIALCLTVQKHLYYDVGVKSTF